MRRPKLLCTSPISMENVYLMMIILYQTNIEMMIEVYIHKNIYIKYIHQLHISILFTQKSVYLIRTSLKKKTNQEDIIKLEFKLCLQFSNLHSRCCFVDIGVYIVYLCVTVCNLLHRHPAPSHNLSKFPSMHRYYSYYM